MLGNKIKFGETFFELFRVVLTGDKDDSRQAAREVRKFLYSSRDRGHYNDLKLIIKNAPNEYRKISEDWREENFVIAVSVLYFLHDQESQPDFLFPWLLYLLQHKNGNIRQSAVRMIEHEIGALTVHIRCPEYKQSQEKSKQSDLILLSLFYALDELLWETGSKKYKRYKYISALPSSPYKSVQMVLGRVIEYCGPSYIKDLERQLTAYNS